MIEKSNSIEEIEIKNDSQLFRIAKAIYIWDKEIIPSDETVRNFIKNNINYLTGLISHLY